MNDPERELQFQSDEGGRNWDNGFVDDKIRSIRDWIQGPGQKLLMSQTSKPYNFDEATAIRKAHEQFEFKCMKALENFAALCEYRKQNVSIPELNELDYMVQNYVDRLNKRTFFVVSCFSYFRLVEELWKVLENMQKRSKEVDTYDLFSIKSAISEIESGIEKSELRLNNIAHELDRLKVILTPSDSVYLNQLENSFEDTCKTSNERLQEMRIRKLLLKKHSKLLECEENVYESIGWIEELLENIELLYQDNAVGKNQMETHELLIKCMDIYTQAKTTYAYCNQLLETYTKLCETDNRRMPRNILLSRNRLLRVWPRLETRIREFRERTEAAENVYSQLDVLLNRTQEYLLEVARSPIAFDRVCGSPTANEAVPVRNETQRMQLEQIKREFLDVKNLGLALVDRIPKGLLADDPTFTGPASVEVCRLIRLKLYTLWLKLREYEYLVLGHTTTDQTIASELGMDTTHHPIARSRSTNSTFRRGGSSFDGADEEPPQTMLYSPHAFGAVYKRRNPHESDASHFHPSQSETYAGQSPNRLHTGRAQSAPSSPLRQVPISPAQVLTVKPRDWNDGVDYWSTSGVERFPLHKSAFQRTESTAEFNDKIHDAIERMKSALTQFESRLYSLKNIDFREQNTPRHRIRQQGEDARENLEKDLEYILQEMNVGSSPAVIDALERTQNAAKQMFEQWLREIEARKPPSMTSSNPVPMSIRLKDLQTDLEECTNRLYDLVNATCLSTLQASQNAAEASENNDRNKEDYNMIISDADVHRISMISEETAGMNGTIPAQERFIQSLLKQVDYKQHPEFKETVEGIHRIWDNYRQRLRAFYNFIMLLEKGYKLLPRIKTFRTEYIQRGGNSKQHLSQLSDYQNAMRNEGHYLMEEILLLIKPDRLTPSAEQLSALMDVRPKINWLIYQLKKELRNVREMRDELELILSNLRPGSSMETVDLGALMPSNPTVVDENKGRLLGTLNSNSAGTLTRLLPESRASSLHEKTLTFPSSQDDPPPPIPPRLSLPRVPSNTDISAPAKLAHSTNESTELAFRPASRGTTSLSQAWRITRHLSDMVCKPTEQVVFTCHFFGPTDLSELDIQWTFRPIISNENNLVYETEEQLISSESDNVTQERNLTCAQLILKSANHTRNGIYTVRITNTRINNTLKSSATLKVIPMITKEVGDVFVSVDDAKVGLLSPVTLSVKYTGFVFVPQVNWLFAGKTVNSKLWRVQTDRNESSISCHAAHLLDQGAYECQIFDPLTKVELRSVGTLQLKQTRSVVSRLPMIVGKGQSAGVVRDGEPLTLRCPLSPSIQLSRSTIDWLHNDQVIYTFEPSHRALISPTSPRGQHPSVSSREHQFQRGQTVWRTYVADGTCILTTNTAHQTDQGSYTCRIICNGEVYESQGDVTILKNIFFTKPLKDVSIRAGQQLQLACHIGDSTGSQNGAMSEIGTDTMRVQWFWNDEPLNSYKCLRLGVQLHREAGSFSLNIPKAAKTHAGTYRCEVGIKGAMIETHCDVDIKESIAPKVISSEVQPSESITVNRPVTITMQFVAEPLPECLWFKDGQPIPTDTGDYHAEIAANRCSLRIASARLEDTGVYQVRLTNECGTVEGSAILRVIQSSLTNMNQPLEISVQKNTDHPAPITVTDGQPNQLFILQPSNVRARSGDVVFLLCILENIDEPLTVRWFHNDVEIDQTREPVYRLHKDKPKSRFHQLEIGCVNKRHAGLYKAKAIRGNRNSIDKRNEASDEATCWITVDDLNIHDQWRNASAPHFISSGLPPHLTANLGEPFELMCHVSGDPVPSFCWIKDSHLVVPSEENDIEVMGLDSTYRLLVKKAKPVHSGEWDLVCYNAHGTLVSTCNVTTSRPVNHVQHPTSTEQTSTVLPPPPTQRELDGNVNASPTEMSQVSSKLGQSSPSEMEPPEFKSVFTDVACRIGESVRLQCRISGCPTPIVHWMCNGKQGDTNDTRRRLVCHGEEYALLIDQANLSDSGRYSLTAENIIGVATCSALLVVCANPVSRPTSALSEPGFFPLSPEIPTVCGSFFANGRQRRHSGTQTPTSQRVAIIRSISMSPLETKQRDYTYTPSHHEDTCHHCSHIFDGLHELDPKMISSRWQVSTTSLKRRRRTQKRSRRIQTGTNVLTRNRSEGSLIHRCPICQTAMTPSSIINEPRLGCLHSTRVVERVTSYKPMNDCQPSSTRKFQPDSKQREVRHPQNPHHHHRHSNHHIDDTYDNNEIPDVHTETQKPSDRSFAEREIPIRILSTNSSQKSPVQIQYSYASSPTKVDLVDNQESHFSVVESSDGETHD